MEILKEFIVENYELKGGGRNSTEVIKSSKVIK